MESMYFDLAPPIAARAMKDLVPCDTNAFGTNFVTYAAYLDYPTTYVICEDDVSLLPTTQGWYALSPFLTCCLDEREG